MDMEDVVVVQIDQICTCLSCVYCFSPSDRIGSKLCSIGFDDDCLAVLN